MSSSHLRPVPHSIDHVHERRAVARRSPRIGRAVLGELYLAWGRIGANVKDSFYDEDNGWGRWGEGEGETGDRGQGSA